MGLLDKAVKLAATAKDQYEELRDARDEASVKPVAPEPPGDHGADVLRRSIAHGAADPATLLTREEASEVLGVELGAGRLTYDDSSVGLEFAAAGRRQEQRWSVAVSGWHGDEDGFDPGETYRFIEESVEGKPVAELGSAALWDGSRLFVLVEPVLFHVEVRTPDDGAARDAAVAVARRVLARIQG